MSDRLIERVVGSLPAGDGSVEVTGLGPLADAVRVRVSDRAATPGSAPAAVVETTGDLGVIRDALQRVADLGTVVLAGPPLAEPVELDLYPDVHVRGLTVVGLPAAAEGRG